MSRQTYIYTLLPVLMLLNSGASLGRLCGTTWALAIGAVLVLLCWMLVWMRLYQAQARIGVRPEFSTLAILPQAAFFALNAAGAEVAAPFAEGPWPGIYLLLWCASAWIILTSLSPKGDGQKVSAFKDPTSLIAGAFVLLSTILGWISSAAQLFPAVVHS